MLDLKPMAALGAEIPRTLSRGQLTMKENCGLALASLAPLHGTSRPSPFGLHLPDPGKWIGDGEISAFWSGPDQWIIEAAGRAESDFANELAVACPGCSITDQTDGFVALEIGSSSGRAPIAALMEKLVNVDPARLSTGSAIRTNLEHMSVFAIRRAPDQLAIIAMRSLAETVWHVLETTLARLEAAQR